ncbi:RebB family R body protein [Vibrio cionasavignyae]|uniref:RebB family R body protein n=1 Tax=Vibrio cionasavignyae TaxID=2910252 RepID=UPI003D0B2007
MFNEEKLAAKAIEGGLHAVTGGGESSKENTSSKLENSEEYSEAMVDTIFADTLSRGMQNAITSQQNAQMASSTSITSACGRILNAQAASKKKPTPIKKSTAENVGTTASNAPRKESGPIKANVTPINSAPSEKLATQLSNTDDTGITANPNDRPVSKHHAANGKNTKIDKAKLATGLMFATSLGLMTATGVLYFFS